MSTIRTLSFKSFINTKGFESGIDELSSMADAISSEIGEKLDIASASSFTVTPKVDTKALASSAGGMAASFLPVGGLIAGGIIAGLQTLKGTVKDIGKTVSKQLNDSFKFDQAQDSLRNQNDIIAHFLKVERDDFARFAKTVDALDETKYRKQLARIRDLEYHARLSLQHTAANFKKGGTLPSFDTLFTNKSKTYKSGGDKQSSGSASASSLISSLNPLKAIGGLANNATSSMLGLGVATGAVVAGLSLLGAGATFLKRGITSASDLAESLNKVDVILGAGSPAVKKFADDMAKQFGMVKGVTLDTAASFGGLGRSLGRMGGDKLAGFSTQFTKLAADLSSFENIDVGSAAEALRTGLSGNQSDLLKKLGVVLTEDTVKQYAYAHGLAKVGTELNEQQKFMARSALITQGLSKVNGDLERTQGGAANQSRKLWGSIENLATSVGTALLPAFTEGLKLLNEFGTWATETFEANKSVVEGWSTAIIESFDWVVAVVHNFPSAFEVARLKIFEALVNIGEWIAVLGPNAVIVASYIARNWSALLVDAFNATLAGLKNLWTNWQAIGTAIGEWFADPTAGFHVNWTPLLDGFKATAEKFPELLKPTLTDMSKEIAVAGRSITDEVERRRAGRAMAPGAAAQVADVAPVDEELKGAKGKKGKQDLLAGALELGSKEAYSAIVTHRSGGGVKVQDKQLKEQQVGNKILGKIERGIGKKNPPMVLNF